MRRALLLFVIAGALTLSASLTAFPQEAGEPQQGAAQYEPEAGEAQYEPEAGEAQYAPEEAATDNGCAWQWGYRWNSAGGWEWWCYDPQTGLLYGTNEDGSGKYQRATRPGSFMMQT